MSALIKLFLLICIALHSVAALPKEDRTRVNIRCIDADTAEVLPCKIARTQPNSNNDSDAQGYITIDLVDPVINLQLTANSSDYATRQISIVPTRLQDSWQTNRSIALARRLNQTMRANLPSINRVRTLAEAGKFDQALAVMEEIERDLKIENRNGSFFARYMYWRSVVAVRACTRLHYETCNKAKDLLNELENAISENRSNFARERVDDQQVKNMLQDISEAEFKHTVARAEWLKRVKKYDEAIILFENIRNELRNRGKSFQDKVSYSDAIASGEITHINTLRAIMDSR